MLKELVPMSLYTDWDVTALLTVLKKDYYIRQRFHMAVKPKHIIMKVPMDAKCMYASC